MTETFSELGRRLAACGEGESDCKHERETASDARLAAANLARDMLTREALEEWTALYPALPVSRPRDVLIITAGNIPFVGVHDLICTLAAGHRALVKPSSKDLANMTWVVGQLLDMEPSLPVALIENDALPDYGPDAVIAMGSSDTVAAIAGKYAGIPTLLRGNRSSLAVLDGSETCGELDSLADDILMFSGLGCRNVSLVWMPRGYDLSRLQSVLARRADGIGAKYGGNLRQARAMLGMGGVNHLDCGSCLMVENRDFSSRPSVLHYSFYGDPREVADWIAGHAHEIQCIAANNFQFSILNSQFGRPVRLGETQHPRLTDYPDGRDTMKFLETI